MAERNVSNNMLFEEFNEIKKYIKNIIVNLAIIFVVIIISFFIFLILNINNLFENLHYYVHIFFATILISFTFIFLMALIFNEKLRKDFLSSESSGKLWQIAINGATAVLIIAIFISSSIHMINNHEKNSLKIFLNDLNISDNVIKAKEILVKAIDSHKEYKKILRECEKKDEKILAKNKPEYILEQINLFTPESEISKKIRAIAYNKRGPWALFSGSKEINISIPGNVPKGFAFSCQEFYEENITLISAFENNRKEGYAIKVNVFTKQLIYPGKGCKKVSPVDLQINCEDAKLLFSDNVLDCEQESKNRVVAKWKLKEDSKKNILPVFASIEWKSNQINIGQ